MSARMPQDQRIFEEACKSIGVNVWDHKIRPADDMNRGQSVFRRPLIQIGVAAVVTYKSAHHHREIERDSIFGFTGVSQADEKGRECGSLAETEYTVERCALLE